MCFLLDNHLQQPTQLRSARNILPLIAVAAALILTVSPAGAGKLGDFEVDATRTTTTRSSHRSAHHDSYGHGLLSFLAEGVMHGFADLFCETIGYVLAHGSTVSWA